MRTAFAKVFTYKSCAEEFIFQISREIGLDQNCKPKNSISSFVNSSDQDSFRVEIYFEFFFDKSFSGSLSQNSSLFQISRETD